MFKKIIFTLSVLSFGYGAHANNDLQSQLMAIQSVEQKGEQAIAAEQAAKKAEELRKRQEAEQKQKAEKQRLAKLAKEKAKRAAKERARRLAEKKAKEEAANNERLADKYRDQDYQDELRKLEIDRQRLALKREETKANRDNDVINAQLAREAAKTDVIQSDADVARKLSDGQKTKLEAEAKATVNISEGVKSNLESSGKAKLNVSEGVKSNLESSGRAVENESNSLF